MTEALGRAIGRPIRYVAITDEQWANAVKERVNPHALDHLTHLWQYLRRGKQRFQPTDTIRVVTGQDPQTLEDFFRANAKAIGAGQPVVTIRAQSLEFQ
jgi:precorrin-6B methylase 2